MSRKQGSFLSYLIKLLLAVGIISVLVYIVKRFMNMDTGTEHPESPKAEAEE